MTNFAKVTEYCECEDRELSCWIQLEGNEEQLAYLDRLTQYNGFDDILYVDLCCVETEEAVDVLVRHTADRYCMSHNKLKGKLRLPKEPKKKTTNWFEEYFYRNLHKGAIEKYVK